MSDRAPSFAMEATPAARSTPTRGKAGAAPRPSPLRIGTPGGSHEREAHSAAAQMLGFGGGRPRISPLGTGSGGELQPDALFGSRLDAANAGGRSLSPETRAAFEPRLGRDLGHVRVHDGTGSAQLAQDVDARAFTHGSHIHFGRGEYEPQSARGQQVLAHEVAHTAQQGQGRSNSLQRWSLKEDGGKWLADKVISPETRQFLDDLYASIKEAPNHALGILGEVWDSIKEHWISFTVVFLAFLGAEAAVGELTVAPEPTFLTKLAAFVLQSLILIALAYFGTVEIIQVVTHAMAWWRAVGAAHGDKNKIAEASKSFCRMLLHIALLVLTIIGAKAKLRGLNTAGEALAEGGATAAPKTVVPDPVVPKPAPKPAVPKAAPKPAAPKPAAPRPSGPDPVTPKPAEPAIEPPAATKPPTIAKPPASAEPPAATQPPTSAPPPAGSPPRLKLVPKPKPPVTEPPVSSRPGLGRGSSTPRGGGGRGGGSGSGGGGRGTVVELRPRAPAGGVEAPAVRPAASAEPGPAFGPDGSALQLAPPEVAPPTPNLRLLPKPVEVPPEVAPPRELAPEVGPPEFVPPEGPGFSPEVPPEVAPQPAPEAPIRTGEGGPAPVKPPTSAAPQQGPVEIPRKLPVPWPMPPPMPEVPPGEAVNLKLPPWKTVHVDYYRGLVEGRLLWHSRGRGGERNTKQIGKWERDTRQVIHPEVLSDGREMGLPRRQILRPAWTRELDLEPTEVDHIVEYQLRPLTNSAFIDEAWNFELLDEASNNASGNRLKQNIIDERRRLAARTADMLWLVCDIQFTRLQLEGLAPAGRWQRDEVARGDHLREFKRRKLDPTKYGGTRPASATEDEQ